jgi:hypothetical protein
MPSSLTGGVPDQRMQEEAETHKNITARARQLSQELATTTRDRNEKRRVCRRQALELASVRKWHEEALLAQAKQFKQTESNAAVAIHENVCLPDKSSPLEQLPCSTGVGLIDFSSRLHFQHNVD